MPQPPPPCAFAASKEAAVAILRITILVSDVTLLYCLCITVRQTHKNRKRGYVIGVVAGL
jgi:hypothetical protein